MPSTNYLPVAYSVPNENTSPRFAKAWARGCGGQVESGTTLRFGPVAMFGSPARWAVLHQAIAEGRDWYYADHGYFGRAGNTRPVSNSYYRITKNAYQISPMHLGCPPKPNRITRLDQLDVSIRPWRVSGSHILVCPPDDKFAKLFGFSGQDWTNNVKRIITKLTCRPIRVRERACASKSSIQQDLVDAWCLVTYVSSAAVDALIMGIPVICLGLCAGLIMGSSNIKDVVNPLTPDGREEWVARLASNQWTLDEVSSGIAWQAIGVLA